MTTSTAASEDVGMNFLVDLANITYVVSYSVRDVLLLRVFAVIGGVLLIPYYYYQPTPLMAPVYWGLAFIALNLFWVVKLLLERRPVKLTEEEQRLYRLVFRTLTPREMRQLLNLAHWETRDVGHVIEKEGEAYDLLTVIVSGRASVQTQGRRVSELGVGQFIGQLSIDSDELAPVSVVVAEPVRLVSWQKHGLKAFLKGKTELLTALELILGVDLRRSLRATLVASALEGRGT